MCCLGWPWRGGFSGLGWNLCICSDGALPCLVTVGAALSHKARVETGEGDPQCRFDLCLVHLPVASGFLLLQAEIKCMFHEAASARRVSSFTPRNRAPDALLPGATADALTSPPPSSVTLLSSSHPFLPHLPQSRQSSREDTSWCWPDPSSPGSEVPRVPEHLML